MLNILVDAVFEVFLVKVTIVKKIVIIMKLFSKFMNSLSMIKSSNPPNKAMKKEPRKNNVGSSNPVILDVKAIKYSNPEGTDRG